jgi:hypothetical protein
MEDAGSTASGGKVWSKGEKLLGKLSTLSTYGENDIKFDFSAHAVPII